METNYTLKRLKLLGPLVAVFFFAVLFFGSLESSAQNVVTIQGPGDVCVSADDASDPISYTALFNGAIPPEGDGDWEWEWDIDSSDFESFYAESNTATVEISWPAQMFNGTAQLTATFTPVGEAPVSATLQVNMWVEIDPNEVDVDAPDKACASETVAITGIPGSNYTDLDWTKTGGPGEVTFSVEPEKGNLVKLISLDDPENDFGLYSFTFTVTNGVCAPFEKVIEIQFFEEPIVALVPNMDMEFCHDDDNIDLLDYVEVQPHLAGSWSFTVGEDEISADFAPGDHPGNIEITATFLLDEHECEDAVSLNFYVSPLASDPSMIEFDGEACYGENVSLRVTHSDAVGSIHLEWEGPVSGQETELTVVGTTTYFTFGPDDLDVGVYTFTATFHETLPGGGNCSFEVQEVGMEITPPVYVTFSPFYRSVNGVVDDIDFVQLSNDPIVGNVPVYINAPLDLELYVEFSNPVSDEDGIGLPDTDQGEFIYLEKWSKSEQDWVELPVFVSKQDGIRYLVHLIDPVSGQALDLEYETYYRIRHLNVFKTNCGEGDEVEYRLDRVWDGTLEEWVVDEEMMSAYAKSKEVVFKTMPEKYAYLPTVMPIGDDDRCEDIYVQFENPVRFRSLQWIGEGESVTGKFRIEKRALDSNDPWVNANIIDKVIASEMETVAGGDNDGQSGPTRMDIMLSEEMEYGQEYRVVMLGRVVPGLGPDPVYGFYDLVLDVPVLEEPIDFNTDNTGLGGGWSWQTSPEFSIVVDVDLPDPVFGTYPDNTYNVQVDGTLLIVSTATDTWEKIDTEFILRHDDGAFDIQALDSGNDPSREGYHFLHWTLNGEIQPTYSDDPEDQAGVDYFPKSFNFAPANNLPECDETGPEFKAYFGLNSYDVHVRAYDQDGVEQKDNRGTVEGGVDNHQHGQSVILTATPNPGFYFVGWDYNDLPPSVIETLEYSWADPSTPEDLPHGFDDVTVKDIWDPTSHTSQISFELVGPLTHEDNWNVKAKFAVFVPEIFAASQAIDSNGDVLPNFTSVDFTLLLTNMLDYSIELAGDFPPDILNYYEYISILYGNPTSASGLPIVGDHFGIPITVEYVADNYMNYGNAQFFSEIVAEPVNVPDNFRWVNWERWNPYTEDWVVFQSSLDAAFYATANHRIRANFEQRDHEVVLEADPVEGGEVSGAGWYDIGEIVEVNAIPAEGWYFVEWTDGEGEFVSGEPFNAIEMPDDDLLLIAHFAMIDYTLSLEAQPEEGGEVFGAGTYNFGDPVEVDAVPSDGWVFKNWTDADGEVYSEDAFNLIDMPAQDLTLNANFLRLYEVSLMVEPSEAGTVSGAGLYTHGDEVVVTAEPNPEWEFTNWTDSMGNVVSDEEVYSFPMPENDLALTANFETIFSAIAGQVRYFNRFGTPLPSPSSHGHFVVRLYDDEGNLIEQQDARLRNGKLSAFDFNGLLHGQAYTIKVLDPGYLELLWSTLAVNAGDALVAQQMGLLENMEGRPWLGTPPNYSDFGVRLGDVTGSGSVGVLDAHAIMQRVVGQTDEFNVSDFQVAAAFGPFEGDDLRMAMLNPNEDLILFSQNGNEFVGEVYLEEKDDFVLDLFFVATADLRARSIPQQSKDASMHMVYDGIQNVGVGEEILIPISLTGDAKLGAMTIDLSYDISLLEILTVKGEGLVYNITDNKITIASIEPLYAHYGESIVGILARVVSDISANDRFFEVAARSELASPEALVVEGLDFSTYALSSDNATGVGEIHDGFSITNYPNPFSQQTTITYQLPETADVLLMVYNQQGQVVRTLVNEKQDANVYTVVFEREALNAGLYFYRIVINGESGSYSSTNSMLIMR